MNTPAQTQTDQILPAEMTIEELVETREQINYRMEELKGALTVFNGEILIRLDNEKLSGLNVGDRAISKVRRVSFDVTLDQAKELGAVKEAVDQDALKKLDRAGVTIPGKKVSEYIMVKEIKHDDEEAS